MRQPRRRAARRSDERGEVFPVAILYGMVMLTVLLALHMTLFAMARTAVSAAAGLGLTAAQGELPGKLDKSLPSPVPADYCGNLVYDPVKMQWSDPVYGQEVTPGTFRECAGIDAAFRAMLANASMVQYAGPATVMVDETAGIARVVTRGWVRSPIFGSLDVRGYACGPLDSSTVVGVTSADLEKC